MALTVLRAMGGVTVQDRGRPGFLSQGLSRGGAMDRLALAEGAALLGQPPDAAALEIAAGALSLRADAPMRIALTGAPMSAACDGAPLTWHASHAIPRGARIDIAARGAGYGYLHVGGGIATRRVLGSRSAHVAAGIGRVLAPGDNLPLGDDPGHRTGMTFTPLPRWDGGTIRCVTGPQTALFDDATRDRFAAATLARDARGNRMGQRLTGGQFPAAGGLSILSDVVVPGDIQITGDGTPFVLLAECQTTGGYPRIASVLPCDLPRLVQAPPGAPLRFALVTLEDARGAEAAEDARRADLHRHLRPMIRDPHDIPDLLAYQLVSGVTAGHDPETEPTT
jgi:allophanate hydrolase